MRDAHHRGRSCNRHREDRRDRSHECHRRRSRSRGREREGREAGERPRHHHHEHYRRSRSPRRSRSRSLGRRSRSRDKERRRHRDRSRGRHRKSHSRSRSRSHSPSTTSSSSDSDDHRKRRRKEKKDKKKHKKDKKKKGGAMEWGKYGIINETDLYNKEQEFRAWLVEERKINPETITKDQTKKEFARFVEDYNTATLPHEKFYHMEAYERRMNALRAGEYVPPSDDAYDPNADMRALQNTHKRRAIERETYMNREQLQELRKVQNERIEAGKMKLLGMDVKQSMGVRMDGSMFDG